ncbi:hypothetical protein [Chelativorans sp. YIM 93263]|uniref:hypothetical protein n=1 Tax=Chelativorans sp. YIM 93263 TaxID=2906648 RepID=UPI002378EE05|nr:hypothetical protein [Chelativorans sp. YIM 93263]
MYAADMCRPTSAGPMEKLLPLFMALAFMLAPLAQHSLMAQGLDNEEAIDKIIGSDVKTEETNKGDQSERVVAAIDNTLQNAEAVRKAFSLDTLEIVFLSDIGQENGAIEEAIASHETEIASLRQSIEGSAMFYHAVDSRDILLRNIVAVEFGEDDTVTIFVEGNEN